MQRALTFSLVATTCLLAGCRLMKGEETLTQTPGTPEPTTLVAEPPELPKAESEAPEPSPVEAPPEVEKPKLPEPGEYACLRTTAPPEIDGVIGKEEWAEAGEITEFFTPKTGEEPATQTTARLLWDDKWLYWSVEAVDYDLFALRSQRDDMLCRDDVFELFLKPSEDARPYYEIEINPRNATFDLFYGSRGSGGDDRWKGWNPKLKSAVQLQGTLNGWRDKDDGWSMELALPLDSLHVQPEAGDVWKFAVCRYDYSVYLENAELSSCAPLTTGSFHRYEDYMDLKFLGADSGE